MSVFVGDLTPEQKEELKKVIRPMVEERTSEKTRYFYDPRTGRTTTVLPGQDASRYIGNPQFQEISRERLRELRQTRNPDVLLRNIQRRYRAGEVSAHDVAQAADEILRLQGVEEQDMILSAPKGHYYRSAQEVNEHNRKIVEYNRQVREYRLNLLKSLLRGEEAPRPPPYAYGTSAERDQTFLEQGEQPEPVRTVTDTQGPISPFISELSENRYDVPADTRPLYSRGRPPSDLEMAMGVGRGPSQFLRFLEGGVLDVLKDTPKGGGWQNVRQGLGFLGRITGDAATLSDPLYYMSLPGVAMAGATYLSTAGLPKIMNDVFRSGEEYVSTRLASPELLSGDVGSVLVGTLFFKGLGKAGGAVGRQLSKLPGEPMRAGRLAVISGESPIPFKTALQVSGVSDTLGGLTSWRTLPRFLKLKGVNLSTLSLERPMPGVGVVGAATGVAPLPFRQAWEITRQYGGVKVPTPGLIRFLGIPGVTTALPQAVWHIPGSSFAKFMLMPGAVEPYAGRAAAKILKDLSEIRLVKAGKATANLVSRARVAAEERARDMEAFMRSTFEVPKVTGKGALVTIQTDVRQLVKMGRQAGAVDVFPFAFTAVPRGVLLEKPDVKVSMRPTQDIMTKMDQRLRDAADMALKPVQLSDLKLAQPQLLEQLQAADTVLKTVPVPRLSQGPRLAQAPIITTILKQVAQQTQKQATRQLLTPVFDQVMRQSPATRRLMDQLKGKPKGKGRARRKGVYELRADYKPPTFKLPTGKAAALLKPAKVKGLEPKKKKRRRR